MRLKEENRLLDQEGERLEAEMKDLQEVEELITEALRIRAEMDRLKLAFSTGARERNRKTVAIA
ncbi:hypothetical protein FRB99_007074, partial [Tulasnella sp. 403]